MIFCDFLIDEAAGWHQHWLWWKSHPSFSSATGCPSAASYFVIPTGERWCRQGVTWRLLGWHHQQGFAINNECILHCQVHWDPFVLESNQSGHPSSVSGDPIARCKRWIEREILKPSLLIDCQLCHQYELPKVLKTGMIVRLGDFFSALILTPLQSMSFLNVTCRNYMKFKAISFWFFWYD